MFKPWRAFPPIGQIIDGLSLGGMNILFYYAIDIPLGIGVALEYKVDSLRHCLNLLLPDMKGEDSLDPVGVTVAAIQGNQKF